MQRYKTGLIIGRFQPFHNGHAYLIQKSLSFCDHIVIGIGSANVTNVDNPWDFAARKHMVDLFLTNIKLHTRVKAIIAIEDNPSDEVWVVEVLKKVGSFDVVIGNNDWVNTLLHMQGYDIVSLPFYKRYLLEGQKIRMLMKENKSWKTRVPNYIAEYIKNTTQQF